jgi:hypothetical protein
MTLAAGTTDRRPGSADWACASRRVAATAGRVAAGPVAGAVHAVGRARQRHPPSWLDGSNCQRFAYGVLALFGLACPPLWSSDLWDDRAAAAVVRDPEPLDLMLYNKTADPFSAHVAVWMAPGEILHLCHEIGVPAIWPPAMFAIRPRYATLIGLKP